jgi:hypothetical protein
MIDFTKLVRLKGGVTLIRKFEETMKICKWTEDEVDDYWETSCGNAHTFIDGTPTQNHHIYCPYCGGKIEQIAYEKDGGSYQFGVGA